MTKAQCKTVADCQEWMRELLEKKEVYERTSKKKGWESTPSTIKRSRKLEGFIRECQGLKNQLQTRLNRTGWVEVQYGDLPSGQFFKIEMTITDDPKERTEVAGKMVYGEKRGYSSQNTYTLMKSIGDTCFVVSKGWDQGSMVSLQNDRIVRIKHRTRILLGDSPGEGSHIGRYEGVDPIYEGC